MKRLEVFFDYSCPYCLKGHENLLELIPRYPGLEIEWRPCEAHPRPETYGLHSDLCIQGMFYAMEHDIDLMGYHELMYKACLKDGINIEDIDALTHYISGRIDGDSFKKAVNSGMYKARLDEANSYAYEQSGVWALPSYRMNGMRLDAIENVGVTKKQLREFLELNTPNRQYP